MYSTSIICADELFTLWFAVEEEENEEAQEEAPKDEAAIQVGCFN
jgi:hypothetical protein